MSKLLISLLALDIGVSLSKVYISNWKLNYLANKNYFFSKRKKFKLLLIFFCFLKIDVTVGKSS